MIFKRLVLGIIITLWCCLTSGAYAAATDSIAITKRLAVIEGSIPLPYHRTLPDDIRQFSSKILPSDYKALDSLIEKELAKRNMPLELKYLPMSLSGLKADYEKDERCGIWSLPTLVALRYGLTVDAFHDERFAVTPATVAALDYLSDLYKQYGDWWKSILAFANSPAALQAATLRQTKHATKPWDYFENPQLPNTHIIGDFMASYYVFSSGNKMAAISSEEFEFVDFDQPLSLESVSDATGLSATRVKMLNPVFRSNPMQPLAGYALRLPEKAARQLKSRLDALYMTTANAIQHKEEQAAQQKAKVENAQNQPLTYRVRSGDMLGRIARKYNVTVRQLKNWNDLHSDVIRPGQVLIVSPGNIAKSKPSTTSSNSSGSIKTTYSVKLGDTLSAIARKHKVTVNQIKKWNNLKTDMIREGQRLIIYNNAS